MICSTCPLTQLAFVHGGQRSLLLCRSQEFLFQGWMLDPSALWDTCSRCSRGTSAEVFFFCGTSCQDDGSGPVLPLSPRRRTSNQYFTIKIHQRGVGTVSGAAITPPRRPAADRWSARMEAPAHLRAPLNGSGLTSTDVPIGPGASGVKNTAKVNGGAFITV